MKLKDLFINTLLVLISIYLPIFLFSFFDYFIISGLGEAEKIKSNKLINEDLPLKIKAVKSGYLPTFYPQKILKKDHNTKIYPIGSLPLTKTYLCNEGYGLIKYNSDRFGLRNDDDKWKKIQGMSNIFLVGDSFVEGACVRENSTISSNIESVTNLNTISLGMGSNGPYEYQAILNSIIKPILERNKKENKVVLTFFVNDNLPVNEKKEKLLNGLRPIINISKENRIIPTKFYTENIKKTIYSNFDLSEDVRIEEIKRNTKFYTSKSLKRTPIYYSLSLYPIRKRIKNLYKSPYTKQYTNSPSEKSINLLAEICKAKCKPFIAYIPPSNFWRPQPDIQFKTHIRQVTKNLGLKFIDGDEVIDRNNRKHYAPKGGHLSNEGYLRISQLIINSIKNN
tara:strand:+ start:64 stop:1248 length:1185 start_codon:yes stop_codon:yes gene_type:complete